MNYIQKALLELLEDKNLDDITVKEVCAKANVSRQTIYYHYASLTDVFIKWVEEELTDRLKSKNTYQNWVDGYKEILVLCKEYRVQVTNVYDSSCRDEMYDALDFFGRELVRNAVETISDEKRIPLIQKDREFLTKFYMYIFMGILDDYIRGGMTEDYDYIASRCELMMGFSIREKEQALFELYKEGLM